MSGLASIRPRGGHLGLILPLVSASTAMGVALFGYPMVIGFQQAKPSITGKPLARYLQAILKPVASIIVPTVLASAVSGLVCARWLQTHITLETTAVSRWYIYGSVFAASHFAYVPFTSAAIKKMIDAGTSATKSDAEMEAENDVQLKQWLFIHSIRTILADLPALICFAEGVAQSLWII